MNPANRIRLKSSAQVGTEKSEETFPKEKSTNKIWMESLGVGRVVYGFWLDTSKRQKKILKLAKFELFRKKRVRPASAHSTKSAKKKDIIQLECASQIEFECEKNNIEHKNNLPLNLQLECCHEG